MLANKKDIKSWLDKYKIEKYTINEDLTVDVEGNVDISSQKLDCIEVQFGQINGIFNCGNNLLINLQGCPTFVGNTFLCDANKLTTLEYGPNVVGGNYNCDSNNLKSLKGCAKSVGGSFSCGDNPIENLDDFICEFTLNFIHEGNKIALLENFYELKAIKKEYEKYNPKPQLNQKLKDKLAQKDFFSMSVEDNLIKNPIYKIKISYEAFLKILLNEKLNNNLPINNKITKKIKI